MSVSKINPAVKSMSTKDMERTIIDILTDNGMSEGEAKNTAKSMSTKDMENYIDSLGD